MIFGCPEISTEIQVESKWDLPQNAGAHSAMVVTLASKTMPRHFTPENNRRFNERRSGCRIIAQEAQSSFAMGISQTGTRQSIIRETKNSPKQDRRESTRERASPASRTSGPGASLPQFIRSVQTLENIRVGHLGTRETDDNEYYFSLSLFFFFKYDPAERSSRFFR